MARTFVDFPKVGLGNMMLVWARAVVFSKTNEIPLTVSFWWGFRLGPFLRGEKQKRFYWRYFSESSLWSLIAINFYKANAKVIYDPPLSKLSAEEKASKSLFVFSKFEIDKDLFGYIRNHSKMIRQELLGLLHPSLATYYQKSQPPVISIHVRRGDFKRGTVLTPNEYFISMIYLIRQFAGSDLPVTIFSDATEEEISDLLELPATKLSDNAADILDILAMSDSKFIVLSGSSTFSYWGAFLSDALVVRPPDWQSIIKHPGGNYAEIQWDGKDPLVGSKVEAAIQTRLQEQ